MADTIEEDAPKRSFSFIRSTDSGITEYAWSDGAEKVRQALGEALNARNVAFLLGAGCSSSWRDDKELGIHTMAPLAKEFTQKRDPDVAAFPSTAERNLLLNQFGIDISSDDYSHNLERLMELLFSLRFSLKLSNAEQAKTQLVVINSIIEKVQAFLWTKCTAGAFAHGDNTVSSLYEAFYRKLVLRDLFREFQSRIVREQSVLFTMGYAFGDEHINNIIYQALTIPTFRLVIFADPGMQGEIAKLRKLNDPRIWIIGGEGPEEGRKAHFFDTIIDEFMPQRPTERIDDAVKKVLEVMTPKKGAQQ